MSVYRYGLVCLHLLSVAGVLDWSLVCHLYDKRNAKDTGFQDGLIGVGTVSFEGIWYNR
jgi:hypothetical protein